MAILAAHLRYAASAIGMAAGAPEVNMITPSLPS